MDAGQPVLVICCRVEVADSTGITSGACHDVTAPVSADCKIQNTSVGLTLVSSPESVQLEVAPACDIVLTKPGAAAGQ